MSGEGEGSHNASQFRKRLLPLSVLGGGRTQSAPAASASRKKRPTSAAGKQTASRSRKSHEGARTPSAAARDAQASSHQAAPAAEPSSADGKKVSLTLPPALGVALMPFQREGVIFGVQHGGRVLIGDEMGLGKTLQALALAWHFRAEWPLLIVTPSSVRGAWMDEMEKWFPSLSPTDFNMVRSGADIGNFDAKITLITYNLLRQPMLHEKIEARKFKFIILDECHYIKSSKSQRTKKLMPLLQQSQRLLLLSGTPALSRPEELYTQLQALRPGTFGSFSAFSKRYCDAKQTRFGWDTRGASNLDELNGRLRDIMIRRLKRTVLDQLPPKRRQRVQIETTDNKLMTEIRDNFGELQRLRNDEDAQKLDVMQIMSQLYVQTSNVKISGVKDYIDGMCNTGAKFLVFAYHVDMLKAIESVVVKNKLDYIMIIGETPVAERQGLVRHFQKDDKCRVAVLSILAASQGITLTAASTVVFAELHWTPGLIEQAEDRAHRIGQKDAVNIHFLVAPGTLDDPMWGTISRKVSIVSTALNGTRDHLHADVTQASDQLESAQAQYGAAAADDGGSPPPGFLTALMDTADDASASVSSRRASSGGAMDLMSFFKGNSKSPETLDVGPWQCHACTFLNTPTGISGKTVLGLRACNMCSTPRPRPRQPSARTPTLANPFASKDMEQGAPPHRAVSRANRTGTVDSVDSFESSDEDEDSEGAADRLHFCISANTGRIWLYDNQRRPMCINFHMEDFKFSSEEVLPAYLQEGAGRAAIQTFIRSWNSLRGHEKKKLANIVMKDIADGRKQQREKDDALNFRKVKGSTQRFSEPGSFDAPAEKEVKPTTRPLPASLRKTPPAKVLMRKIRETARERTAALQVSRQEQREHQHQQPQVLDEALPTLPAPRSSDKRPAGDFTPGSAKRSAADADEQLLSAKRSPVIIDVEADEVVSVAEHVRKPSSGLSPQNVAKKAAYTAGNDALGAAALSKPRPATVLPEQQPTPPAAATAASPQGDISCGEVAVAASAATSAAAVTAMEAPLQLNAAAAADAAKLCCRHCNKPLPKLPWEGSHARQVDKRQPQQQRFCSHECWERFSILTGNAGLVRTRLREMEKGVCQICKLDAQRLFKTVKALEQMRDRIRALGSTPFAQLDLRRLEKIAAKPKEGDFWQADHIQAVCEGGGECDLDNYRTLCTPCHMKVTGELRPGMKERKLAQAAEGSRDIRTMFAPRS